MGSHVPRHGGALPKYGGQGAVMGGPGAGRRGWWPWGTRGIGPSGGADFQRFAHCMYKIWNKVRTGHGGPLLLSTPSPRDMFAHYAHQGRAILPLYHHSCKQGWSLWMIRQSRGTPYFSTEVSKVWHLFSSLFPLLFPIFLK